MSVFFNFLLLKGQLIISILLCKTMYNIIIFHGNYFHIFRKVNRAIRKIKIILRQYFPIISVISALSAFTHFRGEENKRISKME